MANKMPVSELAPLGLLLLLYFSVILCTLMDNECWTLGDFNLPVLEQDGDIIIGGLFPMHYIALETVHNYSEQPQHQECSGYVKWLTENENINEKRKHQLI